MREKQSSEDVGRSVETKENDRKKEEDENEPQSWGQTETGGLLLIMDWFSLFFFEGVFFLSPSRRMVIAPPPLIMCWIGKKNKRKALLQRLRIDRFLDSTYCNSSLSPVTALFLPAVAAVKPLTFKHTHAHTDVFTPMVKVNDRRTNYSDVEVQEDKKKGGEKR